MSQNRNQNGTRTRQLNVDRVDVQLRQLRGQLLGEVAHAYGASDDDVRISQQGGCDDDFECIQVVHRSGKTGKVVGRATLELPECTPDQKVSVVSRDGQSALRAWSEKAEALIAHDSREQKRKGRTSEVHYRIRDNRDADAVRAKHGLSSVEAYDFDDHAGTVAEVRPSRDPGSAVRIEKRRR